MQQPHLVNGFTSQMHYVFLVERNQLLGKVTNLWVDVYVHTNVSIPKGCKFDYEY